MSEPPTDIEKSLAWLVDNSEGVMGLKLDGTLMPWNEVLSHYLPWWSGSFADKELGRVTGEIRPCSFCGADLEADYCPWCDE